MYQLRFPDPLLAPYIENYWFVTPDDGPVELKVEVFVDGRADLIFNFGAPYSREVIGGETASRAASNLDAQRLVPIRIVQRGLVRIVGVRFRLGGLGPFVGGDLRPYTNLTPSPAEVFGPDVVALEEALKEAGPDEAAGLLDRFFQARLEVDAGRAPFERALASLVESNGAVSVDQAARRAGVSVRQVDRLFARQVGVAPKTVARILRFQSTLRALMGDPGGPLAGVAAEAGYFDQAHFIREFKQMSGGVPRGYRGYFPPEGPRDFAPNVVVFVQDRAGGAKRG